MNGFRLFGDLCHLFALITIIYKMCRYRSSAGISGKSQVLLGLVFTSRYLDLLYVFISLYNTIFKIVFIVLTLTSVFLVYVIFRKTYERNMDTFCALILVIAALILAIFVNQQPSILEIFWSFSVYLEAVAMWPQFFIILKRKQVYHIVFTYLLALGLYRTMYIFNWIYRYMTENYYSPISTISGIVQVIPFIIFLIFCITQDITIQREHKSYYNKNLAESNIFIVKVNEEIPKLTSDKGLVSAKPGHIEKSNILFNIKN